MNHAVDDLNPSLHDWRGTVFVWDEQAIFMGQAADASLHESPAIKICVALERSFGLRSDENDTFTNYTSAMIAPGQLHGIDGRHNRMVMLLLAPETRMAQRLAPIYARSGIVALTDTAAARIRSLCSSLDAELGSDSTILEDMVSAIAVSEGLPIDERIAQSVEWIRSSRERGVSVAEIAAGVELSESRFSHLFTENVRIPVRRYLLWLRLRDAMHLLAQGTSLTEVAHEAGFADSAHLTRTFRSQLGIAPSALIRESTIISFLNSSILK